MANAMHTTVVDNRKALPVMKRGRPSVAAKGKVQKAEYRLQVKMTDEGKARVDDLIRRTPNATAADLVRDALRVYDVINEEIENGGRLYIKDGETGEMMKLRLW